MSPGADRPTLRVGCAMWAHPGWRGTVFPADTPRGAELEVYTTWCTAVEGNTSFYGLPAAVSVERWHSQTPEDFRFMFKLPRTITHDKRLRDAEEEVREARDRLAPLAANIDTFHVQLPASFGPSDLPVLAQFLAARSSDVGWSVEVRHREFADGGPAERALNAVLERAGAERVIIDTRAVFAGPMNTPEEREAFDRKPRLPVRPVAIGNRPVVRFIGQTDPEANPTWWAKWIPKVVEWINEGRTPTVFIHTPDNAVAPLLARRFHAAVAEQVSGLTKLPSPSTASKQLRLL